MDCSILAMITCLQSADTATTLGIYQDILFPKKSISLLIVNLSFKMSGIPHGVRPHVVETLQCASKKPA